MQVELYAFPGSNACLSVELLLEHAGVEYRPRRLLPMAHAAWLRLRGFAGFTVPAARIDGARVQGSRRIAHAVADALPSSGLLPASASAREVVLGAERDGERLQIAVRRLIYVLAQDDPQVIQPLVDASYRALPRIARRGVGRVLITAASAGHGASAERIDHELQRVAELLDRFDALVSDGVLASEPPTVADFQIAPNLALLAAIEQLTPILQARPSWNIAERLCPTYPLAVHAHAPDAWVARLTPGVSG